MPFPIQAIVCAVDFSTFSPLVIRYGAALARRTRLPLYLVHAVHDRQDGLYPTAVFERGGDLTHLTDDAHRRMHALMAYVNVDWEAVVRFGDPVEQTVAFVNGLPPSLLVSASHGVSGFRRLFIGTVVERLTRAVNRPMLVVKPTDDQQDDPFDGFHCLVVGCDGHGHWQRLASLLPLIEPDSAPEIHLVHAMEDPMGETTVASDGASYGQIQQTHQDRLKRQLRDSAKRLFSNIDGHSVTVAPGVPEEMVLKIARERASDMIVVGVRRSGKMGRLISGSTTEGLLRRAPCCVLTLPEMRESNLPEEDQR